MEFAQVGIHRTLPNLLWFGFGSSEMRVRTESEQDWRTYMRRLEVGRALHCKSCDALLILP